MRLLVLALLTLVAVTAALNQTRRKKSSSELQTTSVEVTKLEKKKKTKSTSSSSGGVSSSAGGGGESLGLTDSSDASSTSDSAKKRKKAKYVPPSSAERRGWRKWHRKCKTCPTEMRKKWRDPTIKWVCGTYQRARRSFKSQCMMEYRNCQDGTMFVLVHGGRCKNETGKEPYFHGDHFFYEYKVKMSHESSDSKKSTTESEEGSSSY